MGISGVSRRYAISFAIVVFFGCGGPPQNASMLGPPDAAGPPPDSAPSSGNDAGAGDAPVAPGCAAPGALAEGKPNEDYVIDGERLFAMQAAPGARWAWRVTGGPCDQMYARLDQPTSFILQGSETPQLTIHPTQVGDYTVHVTIDPGDPVQAAFDCTFVIHIAGSGLRVELCWPSQEVDKLDLHLHRPGTRTDWFDANDDCYFMNCGAGSFYRPPWGNPSTPDASCFDGEVGPPSGIDLACPNPRLDLDNNFEPGRLPDATDIDSPDDGGTYRVMADYFSGLHVTYPMTNIYCQGRLIASFGGGPDLEPHLDDSGDGAFGSMWHVADVTTHVDAAHFTRCEVTPLHPPGQTTGFDVRIGDLDY
jgi:hypothetical protein